MQLEWLRHWSIDHWDLGSNPRSPKIIIAIFLQLIQYALCLVVYHASQLSTRQVACKANLKAKDEGPSYSQSMHMWTISEVKQACV